MSDEQELALVFPARALSDRLHARYVWNHGAAKIIKWATKMAAEHSAASDDPAWWITSALRDQECLDAAQKMLVRMT